MQSLPTYTSYLFIHYSHDVIIAIEKLDGICSLTFVVDEFSGLLLHPAFFSIKHSRSAQVINCVLSIFWYRLNSSILMSSEETTALQKSLFSHTFLWDLRLFSVAMEWRQFRQ